MRILVTGKQGQVACCLAERCNRHPDLEIMFAARPGFDLKNPDTIRQTILDNKPDLIISAAAYTAVDQAEDEPDIAHKINGEAPGILAELAHKTNAKIIHISTDYVFDGSLDRPYLETDKTSPLGVYGRTKFNGEQAVRASNAHYAIIRTAWVFSPYGKNFLKTMLSLAQTRDELGVVDDQIGNPTSAFDIADGLLTIANAWRQGETSGIGETYNLAGTGDMTWCGFARAIFAESASRSGPSAKVKAITTANFPTKAKRPANSRLDCTKLKTDFHFVGSGHEKSIANVMDALNK